ncbi:MAG TPA: CHAP domain-containing protein [Candidatus Eremiobacteraeota bacterium]|nr:MAG: CHAP domain protein [bacterium ADurb.Bin363]HPZ07609.1 CHAP domain-containing protein [Candidatus Eremiobacteraeota bacterium]
MAIINDGGGGRPSTPAKTPATPPKTQTANTQTSGTQASGTQTSGTQASGTQASGTQASGTQVSTPQDKTELSPEAQEAISGNSELPANIPISPPRTYSNVPGCSQEQCAEWVQRVFRENGRPLPVHGDAKTLFPQDWGEGYQKQSNGQPGLPPQAGDILCWGQGPTEGSQWGHVAIIKSTHTEPPPPYIEVVEANYSTNDGKNVPVRQIPYDPETNTITQTGRCPVQGWVHPEGDHSLVNAPPGQPGNYVPQAQMPSSPPSGGGTPQTGGSGGAPGGPGGTPGGPGETPGAPGSVPGWGDPGGQMNGGLPGIFGNNPIMSPTGVEITQQIGFMIMSAWQEVMMGNFNGPNLQQLNEWYMQGDKNSQDPIRIMAGNILQMAGMIVPQNSPIAIGGIPPHIARMMQAQQM